MGGIKHVHTVATAHLDTVWNWDFETTIRRYIPHTLRSNFRLFEKHPDYVFNFEGAFRYALMEEYYPEEFEKLRQYVAAGKWYPAGAAWENGDVNVPSPEALFRNFLLGNDYFEKKFGIRSRDVFLPDCFGFGFALPSVAAHSNLLGFTTQKLTWGSACGIPFDFGKWYGPDGKYILASLRPGNYFSILRDLRSNRRVKNKLAENERFGVDSTVVFHGVGDRGGSPFPISVSLMDRNIRLNDSSRVKVHSSRSDALFEEWMTEKTETDRDRLPSHRSELLLTNHGTGGYTSRAISKRWNARGEQLADMAERAAVAAFWLGAAEYPEEQLNTAWKRLICHQFHDDLPGTSIQKAYLRSWNDYGLSMNQFSGEYEASCAAVAGMLGTDSQPGVPLVVNNPMELARKDVVTAYADPGRGIRPSGVVIVDAEGNETPSQIVSQKNGKAEVAFIADMPPYSYKVYYARFTEQKQDSAEKETSDNELENERYRVRLDSNGDVASIFDKELDRELLAAPVALGIFDYKGSWMYPAWELDYSQTIRTPDRTPKLVGMSVVENGPVRRKIRVVQRCGDSVFTNDISLAAGSDRVEVDCEFDWQSRKTLCKNVFAFTANNEEATFDLGLGAIRRKNARPELYEVPAQRWVDLTDGSGEFGVSVISDCKYGWDKFNNNTLRMTVVHTPQNNSRATSMQSMMELGLNRYSYAICSHGGNDLTRIQASAREFIAPMEVFAAERHDGRLFSENADSSGFGTGSVSFGGISDPGVIVRAVKKAENSDEIVVRVNEGANRRHESVRLTLGAGIASAREIYASEEALGEAEVSHGSLVFDVGPYEVRSFALTLLPSPFEPVRPFEQVPVGMPGGCSVFSPRSEKPGGAIPCTGFAIPSELAPCVISSGGVDFPVDKQLGATLCDAQTVTLPPGTEKLVILAASIDGDRTFRFGVGDTSVEIKAADVKERPFSWDLYSMKRTAKIKTDPFGWECTHTRSASGDDCGRQLFFFRYSLPVNGADKVTLPEGKKLLILSAAALKNERGCRLAYPLFDVVEDRAFNYRIKGVGNLLEHGFRKLLGLVWMIV
ncbi:MAG: hypothetical protein K6C36_00740 [Clostridia bacterium]|nr:hypothetical protein [Clostridia bacterium]